MLLIYLLILIFSLLILDNLILECSTNYIESYMAVIPKFTPKFQPKNTPQFKPTNTFYKKFKITQDFDPDSVITFKR
jgi:hypothetical protein